jgi:hypothetical protein
MGDGGIAHHITRNNRTTWGMVGAAWGAEVAGGFAGALGPQAGAAETTNLQGKNRGGYLEGDMGSVSRKTSSSMGRSLGPREDYRQGTPCRAL